MSTPPKPPPEAKPEDQHSPGMDDEGIVHYITPEVLEFFKVGEHCGGR